MSDISALIQTTRNNKNSSFNMTPLIDIVFLLILFFVVVCHFIESENFPVEVPDKCDLAKNDSANQSACITLTVMTGQNKQVEFAVGSNKTDASKLADRLDLNLKNLSPEQRVVNLRIDKTITFKDAKYALAAVNASNAEYVRLSALKEEVK